MGLTQAQLSRIENGTAPQDLGKLMQWAHRLGIPEDLLWFKLPPGQRPSAPVADIGHPEQPQRDALMSPTNDLGELFDQSDIVESAAMCSLDRRSVLKGGIAAAAFSGLDAKEARHVVGAGGEVRRRTDGPGIDHLRHEIAVCKRDDGNLGATAVLPVMLGLLSAAEEQARDVGPNVRRELLSVAADGAEFAGWLYRDINQYGQAVFWYDRAMEWAQEADDPAMQGYVLLKKSQMAYDSRDAVRVLTLAEAAGRPHLRLPLRTRAEVTQQEALGLAMTGEPLHAVERKLHTAQELLAEAPTDGLGLVGAYFTDDTRLLRDAVVYTEAGKPGKASELFKGAIEGGALSPRDTTFFNARRATAVALCGEPDEAARLGRESAEAAHDMKSDRTLRVLSEVLQILKRWDGRPAVRDLREALRGS